MRRRSKMALAAVPAALLLQVLLGAVAVQTGLASPTQITVGVLTAATDPTTSVPPTFAPSTTSTVVGGPNLPPLPFTDFYTTGVDVALVVPAPGVLGNDFDPNGDPLTAGMPTNPSNGTLSLSSDGSFTYTPNPGYAGPDGFTYMAHDPFGGMATAEVLVHVGDAPTTTFPPTTVPGETTTTTPGQTTTTSIFGATTTTLFTPTTIPGQTTTTTPGQTTTSSIPGVTTITTTPVQTTTTGGPGASTTTTVGPGATTTTPGPTTSVAPGTSTSVGPTTTVNPGPTSTAPTTVGPTTTRVDATTTSVAQTTTTAAGDCKPGYGKGDKKHCHRGPPGAAGGRPGADGRGPDGRPVSSTRPLTTPWLAAGLGILVLISLAVPFRRQATRGNHRTRP